MALDYKLMGERIQKARLKKGYTQEYIAEKMNFTVAYLSRIENGKAKINLPRLDQISELLDVKISYIIDGTSNTSATYLNSELNSILKDCAPDKKEMLYKIAHIISEDDDKK